MDRTNAPYVLTKPIHHSQRVVEKTNNGGVIIELDVHHNFELERLILGFGDTMEVLNPPYIKRRIKRKLISALGNYNATQKKEVEDGIG